MVNGQHEMVGTIVISAIRSVAKEVLDEEVDADPIQRAAMRSVVNHTIDEAVADTFLKNDDLLTPISSLTPNCIEKELTCLRSVRTLFGSKLNIRALHVLPPASNSSDDGDMLCKCPKTRTKGGLVLARRFQ